MLYYVIYLAIGIIAWAAIVAFTTSIVKSVWYHGKK